MFEIAATFAVLGGFTFLRVKQLVERRRALGHPEVPAYMPLLAGSVTVILFAPIVWLLPTASEHLGFAMAACLAIGLGVAVGVHSGRRDSER